MTSVVTLPLTMGKGQATDVIYLDFFKALDPSTTSFSLNWMGSINRLLMNKKVVGQLHPEGHGQQLSIPMDINDKWCPSGVCTRTSAINYLH